MPAAMRRRARGRRAAQHHHRRHGPELLERELSRDREQAEKNPQREVAAGEGGNAETSVRDLALALAMPHHPRIEQHHRRGRRQHHRHHHHRPHEEGDQPVARGPCAARSGRVAIGEEPAAHGERVHARAGADEHREPGQQRQHDEGGNDDRGLAPEQSLERKRRHRAYRTMPLCERWIRANWP